MAAAPGAPVSIPTSPLLQTEGTVPGVLITAIKQQRQQLSWKLVSLILLGSDQPPYSNCIFSSSPTDMTAKWVLVCTEASLEGTSLSTWLIKNYLLSSLLATGSSKKSGL